VWDVFVLGVGICAFGKRADRWVEELGAEAVEAAVADSGIDRRRIEAAFCGHAFAGRVAGQRVLALAGISGIPTINVENACTSGATALHLACKAVASGEHEIALALGMDQMTSGLVEATPSDFEGALGRTLPVKYALRARRYMSAFDLTVEDLADVTVKNRALGALNPAAYFRQAVTREEVLASRMIAEPLTLFQCCAPSDGAAAVLVGSRTAAAAAGRTAVRVLASVLCSGRYQSARDGGPSGDDELTIRTSRMAYEQAGCGPEDIQIAEVHDAFSIGEILAMDNLGFCATGEAAQLVRERATWPSGRLPVNTSGGLLSRGHPLGATGAAQVVEIVYQLRGEAGARQLPRRPTLGLTHCTGGALPVVGTGSCCVHIFAA